MAVSAQPPPCARRRAAHQPMRRCVVCRRSAAKAELGRVARTPSGELALGAAEGRGAYVCPGGECAARLAADPRPLARALRTAIPTRLIDDIAQTYGRQGAGSGQEAT